MKMKKRVLPVLLALILCLSLSVPALAASREVEEAADLLYEMGLFNGVGTNADGTVNYDLDRAPTRQEAMTLLVRLLGKESEALTGTWNLPFTDVSEWAVPYIGYAYSKGLTNGTSATYFSAGDTVSAAQYLTLLLRALGYESGVDFQWDKAWELTDKLGITQGQYGADTAFTRGDAVAVSVIALSVKLKDGSKTLIDLIEENMEASGPQIAGLLVKGNLDEIYFGKAGTYYLNLVNSTQEKAEQIHLDGLKVEAEYFAYYFDISYLTEELEAEIVNMYKEIYSHSKYEVGTTEMIDSATYGVPVKVYPLDIMQLVVDDLDTKIDAFNAGYTQEQIENMTDAEYQAYDAAWARMIIDCCKENIADMGYMAEKSFVIQVKEDSEGFWSMYNEDFNKLDEVVIYYP